MARFRTVVDDLVFPECPRWFGGALFFSDMHDHRVLRYDTERSGTTTVATVPSDAPAGLGWLADGRLLIVAQESQLVLRLDPDGSVRTHADLSGLALGSINDMIVRSDGTAYVGDMGLRIHDPSGERQGGRIIRVDPGGEVGLAADGLEAPNGMVLDDDESTLIVAESAGMRLTRFAVAADGALGARRTFADLVPEDPSARMAPPDGIRLDRAGGVVRRSPRPPRRGACSPAARSRTPGPWVTTSSRSPACSAATTAAPCTSASPPAGPVRSSLSNERGSWWPPRWRSPAPGRCEARCPGAVGYGLRASMRNRVVVATNGPFASISRCSFLSVARCCSTVNPGTIQTTLRKK